MKLQSTASGKLSEMSSDATPASDLTAEFDFSYGGGILTLEVTNFTTAPNEFNISEIYFNAVATVTGLTLLSATHSAEGDVLAAWTPVVTNTIVDGFGSFDFGLTDGVGETDVNLIGPSESVLFTFSVSGSATGDFDFIVNNAMGKAIAAKFVNGPDDPESPGNEDSAFGASSGLIPEPGTLSLLGLGLAAFGSLRRSRRA